MGTNVAAKQHTTGTQWTAGAESTQRQPYDILPGHRHPMGATVDAEGVNFSIFSQHATAVELLLFDKHDDPDPVQIIRLDPRSNRAFPFWHVYVKGLRPGAHYAYRIDGPFEPSRFGHRYDRDKVLLDSYAHGITTHLWERASACRPGSNLATSMRCAVIDTSDYDWEGDCPLNHLMSDTII
jgi:isoamylase